MDSIAPRESSVGAAQNTIPPNQSPRESLIGAGRPAIPRARMGQHSFSQLLPDTLAQDPALAAAATALDRLTGGLNRAVTNLLIWPRLLLTAGYPPPEITAPLRRLVEDCGGLTPLPTPVLEALAWQFHVDFRPLANDDRELARLICDSVAWHRIKGTPASVEIALSVFGFKAEVLEHAALDAAWTDADGARWDGKAIFDGSVTWSGPEGSKFAMTRHWAEYALELDVGDAVLTRATQANIRAIANATAPARSHLVGLRYTLSTAFDATITWGNTTTKMIISSHFHVPHFETWRYPRRVWGGTTEMLWDGSATWGDNKRFDGILATDSDTTWSHGWGRWWRATIRRESAFGLPRSHPETMCWDGTYWDRHSRDRKPSHWDGTRTWGEISTPAGISVRTILTYPDGRQEAT